MDVVTKAERERLFELADLILAVSRHINAVKDAEAEPGTPLDGAVMRYVDRHPGTTAGDAAEATQLISSNFSRAARGLEARGLIRREVDGEDGRRVRLYPTDKARDNLQNLRRIWSDLLAGIIDDPAEIEYVVAVLRRVEAGLQLRGS